MNVSKGWRKHIASPKMNSNSGCRIVELQKCRTLAITCHIWGICGNNNNNSEYIQHFIYLMLCHLKALFQFNRGY